MPNVFYDHFRVFDICLLTDGAKSLVLSPVQEDHKESEKPNQEEQGHSSPVH